MENKMFCYQCQETAGCSGCTKFEMCIRDRHDVNDKIIKIIKTYIRAYKVSIYDEKTHTGVLRHLVTKVGFTTKEVMVVLVANGKKLPYLNELASVLRCV